MRTKRLAHEHRLLVYRRKFIAIEVLRKCKMSQLPFTKPMPESADFCDFPPVVEILEQPSDIHVTEESFDSIKEDLQVWIGKWRSKVKVALIKKVKGAQRTGMNGKGDSGSKGARLTYDEAKKKLKLATTVFGCKDCALFRTDLDDDEDERIYSIASASKCRPLFFPHVVGHRCLTLTPFPEDFARGCHRDPSISLIHWESWRSKWSAAPLFVDEYLGQLVENIVEACGLDAGKVTVQEMDRRDDRLACLRCAEMDTMRGYRQVAAFGWREAVRILPP
jgi:hypothetical protein